MKELTIDKIKSSMSADAIAEFDSFVASVPSLAEVHMYLTERGYKTSVTSVANWLNANCKEGLSAKRIKATASAYEGLSGYRTLSAVEGIALEVVTDIRDRLLSQPIEELDSQTQKYIALLPSLLREARSASSQREELKYIKERSALEIAGATRACELVVSYFEGTTFEDGLREAVKGVLLQVEQEVRGG